MNKLKFKSNQILKLNNQIYFPYLIHNLPNKFETYEDEVKYIIGHERRNKFIKNLAVSLGKNTLILYQMVDKHGQILYDMIKDTEKIGNRKVFFVHGGTDTADREEIRRIRNRSSIYVCTDYFNDSKT